MQMRQYQASRTSQYPLAVDLDGTLVKTDTLWEGVLKVVKENPGKVWLWWGWLYRGKAYFKKKVAEEADLTIDLLPWRTPLLNYLQEEHKNGREIILATAADRRIAEAVAAHLGLFKRVIASDGVTNMAGRRKAEALRAVFGAKKFDYAGNGRDDLAVWRVAREALVVGSKRRETQAAAMAPVVRRWPGARLNWLIVARSLRVHQWLKNILLWVPLLLAHELLDAGKIAAVAAAFMAFSLAASGVYILNDLFDLEADRRHPEKKKRMLASGELGIGMAVISIPLLWLGAFMLAWLLPVVFMFWLGFYIVLNLLYSWYLKRLAVVDVTVLSLLYTGRVFAGAAAAAVAVSPWLVALILFLTFSGALAKRYVELQRLEAEGAGNGYNRGYQAGDAAIVGQLGITSSYLSVLVLALYIQSDHVHQLYKTPEWLWAVVIIFFFWVSRVWLLAARGQMNDADPLLSLARDKANYVILGAIVVVSVLATIV
jgi:4-hydroxybenzoate polyprenyltransferase